MVDSLRSPHPVVNLLQPNDIGLQRAQGPRGAVQVQPIIHPRSVPDVVSRGPQAHIPGRCGGAEAELGQHRRVVRGEQPRAGVNPLRAHGLHPRPPEVDEVDPILLLFRESRRPGAVLCPVDLRVQLAEGIPIALSGHQPAGGPAHGAAVVFPRHFGVIQVRHRVEIPADDHRHVRVLRPRQALVDLVQQPLQYLRRGLARREHGF